MEYTVHVETSNRENLGQKLREEVDKKLQDGWKLKGNAHCWLERGRQLYLTGPLIDMWIAEQVLIK